MALSKSEIQRRNDEKRGVKNKVLKMKIEDIDFLEQLAKESSIPQVAIVVEALMLWAEKNGFDVSKNKGNASQMGDEFSSSDGLNRARMKSRKNVIL
ncbi:hypothetical protein DINO107042_00960 [Dichelobacter nodosus]|nr:hypothetical protein DYQ38_04930 [Dichelobacter nodosus]TGA64418.1 hypothetical protein E5E99_04625 [Dichelobacter nodosus]